MRSSLGDIEEVVPLADGAILLRRRTDCFLLWPGRGDILPVRPIPRGDVKGVIPIGSGFVTWFARRIDVNRSERWTGAREEIFVTLKGHRGDILGVLVLQDTSIVAFDSSGTLSIWNGNGALRSQFQPIDSGSIMKVSEAAQGRLLIHDREGRLALWTVEGAPYQDLLTAGPAVLEAQVTDRGLICVTLQGGEVWLWSAAGRPLAHIAAGDATKGAAVLARDRLATWGNGPDVDLWLNPGERFLTLKHNAPVIGVRPSDEALLTWTARTIVLWNTDGEKLTTIRPFNEDIQSVSMTDSGAIVAWDKTGHIQVFDGDGEQVMRRRRESTGEIIGVLPLRGDRALTWTSNNQLQISRVELDQLAELRGHSDWIQGALELDDGSFLTWSADRTIRLWNDDGSVKKTVGQLTAAIRGLRLAQGRRFVTWSDDQILRFWNLDSGLLSEMPGHTEAIRGAFVLASGEIVSWSRGAIRLWAPEGDELCVLPHGTAAFRGCVPATGAQVLSWDSEGILTLWSLVHVSPIAVMRHAGEIRGALVMPDGTIASWSNDRTARLWSPTGTPLVTLLGHAGPVIGLEQFGSGRLLTWSTADDYRIWEPGGRTVARFSLAGDSPQGALVLPDDRLLTWGWTTIALWSADGELVDSSKSSSPVISVSQMVDRTDKFLCATQDRLVTIRIREGTLGMEASAHTPGGTP